MAENPMIIPSPVRFNDETQRKVEGIEQATAIPKEVSRGAQAFAWSPNQAKQAANTVQTREQTTTQRAETVATNMQVEALRQQIKALDAEITSAAAQLNSARQQRQAFESQIGQLQSQLTSENTRLSSVMSEAKQAANTAEQAKLSIRNLEATKLSDEGYNQFRPSAPPRPVNQEQEAAIQKSVADQAAANEALQAFVNRRAAGYDPWTNKDILTPEQRAAENARLAAVEATYKKFFP